MRHWYVNFIFVVAVVFSGWPLRAEKKNEAISNKNLVHISGNELGGDFTRKLSEYSSGDLTKKEINKVPEQNLAGDIARKKISRNDDKPALEYDQFRLGVELQVASKRREQIETLKKIIRLNPGAGSAGAQEAPELAFRLAELYWEESKQLFFDSNRKDDDIIRAKNNQDLKKLKVFEKEKQEAVRKSEYYQSLAIDQYRTIIQKYPKFKRMDEVLFFLGHNMWESGKQREASAAYNKLIKDHPASKYLPDAWLAIGQYYFSNSKATRDWLAEALKAFKKAASYTESKVYGYALYMQGWCYFNMNDFSSALEMFKAVIYFGELQGKVDSRSTALTREARKDYVVAYSRYGDVMLAKADFQKIGGDKYWWGMYKGLANLYYEDGKDKEATIIYNQMIRERPLSPEAAFFQGRIVDCMIRVGNKKVIVAQVRQLVRIIHEVKKAGIAKTDQKAFAEAQDLAERIMSNLAVNWHNEAKKTRDDSVFLLASDIYEDYLSIFSDSPKAYDLRFFYAELLNDNLQKYDRAAEEYSKVLLEDIRKIDPPAGKNGKKSKSQKAGRWMVNAAYNAILAYDEVVKKIEKDEKLSKTDCKTKIAIPSSQTNLIVAGERYMKYLPKGENIVQVTYKVASTYYRYSDFDKAIPLFVEIAMEHPRSELAEYSANLVLDSYNCMNNWKKMNEWARKFFAQPKLAKGRFREELGKVLEQTAFKLVNIAEEKKEYVQAAEEYLAFVREFPRSELADLALFNASVDFFKGKQVERSIEVRRQIVQKYPRSRYLPNCVYANGEAYEAIGDYELAAQSYEAYASGWARESLKRNTRSSKRAKYVRAKSLKKTEKQYEEAKAQIALHNAGLFREALGHYNYALRDRRKYLEYWPKGEDTETVYLSMTDLYQKMKKGNLAIAHLKKFQNKYSNVPSKVLLAEYRMAKLYEKQKRFHRAKTAYKRIEYYYRKKLGYSQRARLNEAAVEGVAQAIYISVESDFKSYVKLSFPKDQKKLDKAFKDKQRKLVELQNRYKGVVKLKAAQPAICSLYKIGLLYHYLADSLMNAPIPQMPFPKQLRQIEHLWNVSWRRWPKAYRDAISLDDLNKLKTQMADAKIQYEQGYRDQLVGWAAPVEEKAADAFITTVQKSRELAIFNECSDEAYRLLSEKYRPLEYPKMVNKLVDLKLKPEWKLGVRNSLLSQVQPMPTLPEKSKLENKILPTQKVLPEVESKKNGKNTKPAVDGSKLVPNKGTQESDLLTEPEDPDLL